MSYLPEDNMIALKKNIKDQLILNKNVSTDELLDKLGCPKSVFSRLINEKSNREISPEMFQSIEIFAITNNIDTKDFCGSLPESYGGRLKYFMYKHYLNQQEFSSRTSIPIGVLFDMMVDKTKVSNKYKDKMCRVLTEEEFGLLSSYGDIAIPNTIDLAVVNGCNVSWNMYKHSPKLIKYEPLFKDLKINMKSYSRFMAGTIKLTKPKIKTIAKYIGCKDTDLTEDTLNLLNLKNKFGYWFANKLYNMNNSIPMFADRCGLDPDYIADIIKGECLIKDKDIKTIASYLNIDPEGLVKICPKSDLELVPISEEKMDLNELVRSRISLLGYTFQEFCNVMDVNWNTMASALHRGQLPRKNREDIIKELDLQDRFPEEVKEESEVETMMEEAKPYTPLKDIMEENFGKDLTVDQQRDKIHEINTGITGETYTPEPFTPIKDMMEENFNTNKDLHADTNIYGFTGYIVDTNPQANKEEETTTTVASTEDDTVTISMLEEEIMDFYDIENVLSIMDSADYEKQISLAKFICMLTGQKFAEDLSSESILGKLARLNLIKDSIK